jgi:UPF0716 protein FxsA
MLFFYLLVTFTAIPLIELMLLIKLSGIVGLIPTIGLVLFTGAFGAFLVRWQGLSVVNMVRQEMNMGRMPASYLVDGVLLLISGALLITPGIITDLLGFSLVLPFSRKIYKKFIIQWLKKKVREGSFHIHFGPGPRY